MSKEQVYQNLFIHERFFCFNQFFIFIGVSMYSSKHRITAFLPQRIKEKLFFIIAPNFPSSLAVVILS